MYHFGQVPKFLVLRINMQQSNRDISIIPGTRATVLFIDMCFRRTFIHHRTREKYFFVCDFRFYFSLFPFSINMFLVPSTVNFGAELPVNGFSKSKISDILTGTLLLEFCRRCIPFS